MSPNVVAALIAGFTAIAAAVLTNYLTNRYKPSRVVQDSVLITDNQGKVIGNLHQELDWMKKALADARAETDGARNEARACRDEVRALQKVLDRMRTKLIELRVDPDAF